MSTIYEWSASNPSTQLTTFVLFELNRTSLVYSELILFSFRSAWACIRSVYTTFINVYYFYLVKMQELFAIAASFGFFVRIRGFSLKNEHTKSPPLLLLHQSKRTTPRLNINTQNTSWRHLWNIPNMVESNDNPKAASSSARMTNSVPTNSNSKLGSTPTSDAILNELAWIP